MAAAYTDLDSTPVSLIMNNARPPMPAITLLARQLTSNGAYIYDSYVWILGNLSVSTAAQDGSR
jgi:hypothetical protein